MDSTTDQPLNPSGFVSNWEQKIGLGVNRLQRKSPLGPGGGCKFAASVPASVGPVVRTAASDRLPGRTKPPQRAGHDPPQSTPLSSPFLIPSKQLVSEHLPWMHAREAQSPWV